MTTSLKNPHSSQDKPQGPVGLVILDGWGWREEKDDNAVLLAKTPIWDHLLESSPFTLMTACGEAVGLPEGQVGNSEVGHINLGAGRVVFQDLPRITNAIEEGSLAQDPTLQHFFTETSKKGGRIHLMGLFSDGGVHAHEKHLFSLIDLAQKAGLSPVIHLFTDGRDTPPRSTLTFLENLQKEAPNAQIGTVSGRYYAMDRDHRWPRVEKAYRAIVEAQSEYHASSAENAVEQAYSREENDEFILPTVIEGYEGLEENDTILFTNFRSDRAREILTTLIDPNFTEFERPTFKERPALGLVSYSEELDPYIGTLFATEELQDVLGDCVSKAGLTQVRAAETEKYPHVTFFFNGGEENPFPGEERILEPSPKVATYDLQPEMSAGPLTDKLVAKVTENKTNLFIINFANPDMVGHTGDLNAAMQAVETVDACLGRLVDAFKEKGGTLLVTADHGNCDIMKDPITGAPHTAHTLNLVPVLLVNGPSDVSLRKGGALSDVAPTLLELLSLPQPKSMTGESLLKSTS